MAENTKDEQSFLLPTPLSNVIPFIPLSMGDQQWTKKLERICWLSYIDQMKSALLSRCPPQIRTMEQNKESYKMQAQEGTTEEKTLSYEHYKNWKTQNKGKRGQKDPKNLFLPPPSVLSGKTEDGQSEDHCYFTMAILNWTNIEVNLMSKLKEKYGFISKCRAAILKILENNEDFVNSKDLSSLTGIECENLIKTFTYYSQLLSILLGGEDFIKPNTKKESSEKMFDFDVISNSDNLYGTLSNEDMQSCFEGINSDKLISFLNWWEKNALTAGIKIRTNVHWSWCEGIGNTHLITEFMIVQYNLACLHWHMGLVQYKTRSPDPQSTKCNDVNIETWENRDKVNGNKDFQAKKQSCINGLKNRMPFVSLPYNPQSSKFLEDILSYYGIPTESQNPLTHRLSVVDMQDIANKTNTYSHFRWFPSENHVNLDMYELLESKSSNNNTTTTTTTVPEDSVDPKLMKDLYSAMPSVFKMKRLKQAEVTAFDLKLAHLQMYSGMESKQYLQTLKGGETPKSNNKDTTTKSVSPGTEALVKAHMSLEVALYHMKKVELVCNDSLNGGKTWENAFLGISPQRQNCNSDLQFLFSTDMITLVLALLERQWKLMSLDRFRQLVGPNQNDPKHTPTFKWRLYCSSVFNTSSIQSHDESNLYVDNRLEHLQLDAIRCCKSFHNPQFMGTIIPWKVGEDQFWRQPAIQQYRLQQGMASNNISSTIMKEVVDEVVANVKDTFEEWLTEVKSELEDSTYFPNITSSQEEMNNLNFATKLNQVVQVDSNSNFTGISESLLWKVLCLTNYHRYLLGYCDMLQKHVIGIHWTSYMDVNANFIPDLQQAQKQFLICTRFIEDFQRYITIHEETTKNNIGHNFHFWVFKSSKYASGPGKVRFQPMVLEFGGRFQNSNFRGNLTPMNRNEGELSSMGSKLETTNIPFLMLPVECFLSGKAISYSVFFKNAYQFVSSLVCYNGRKLGSYIASQSKEPTGLINLQYFQQKSTRFAKHWTNEVDQMNTLSKESKMDLYQTAKQIGIENEKFKKPTVSNRNVNQQHGGSGNVSLFESSNNLNSKPTLVEWQDFPSSSFSVTNGSNHSNPSNTKVVSTNPKENWIPIQTLEISKMAKDYYKEVNMIVEFLQCRIKLTSGEGLMGMLSQFNVYNIYNIRPETISRFPILDPSDGINLSDTMRSFTDDFLPKNVIENNQEIGAGNLDTSQAEAERIVFLKHMLTKCTVVKYSLEAILKIGDDIERTLQTNQNTNPLRQITLDVLTQTQINWIQSLISKDDFILSLFNLTDVK